MGNVYKQNIVLAQPTREWRRCSQCCWFYRPWVSRSTLTAANKLLVLDAKGANVKHILAANEVQFLQIKWADTTTERLCSRFKEISLGLKKEWAKMSRTELNLKILEVIAKNARRNYFKDMQLSPWVQQEIARLNGQATQKFSYDHLLPGFQASNITYSESDPVLDQDAVMTLWAHSSWLVRTMVSRI